MPVSSKKRCSKCKVNRHASCFGYKKNGDEYKTCATCRAKSTHNNSNASQSSDTITKDSDCLILCCDPYKCIHDTGCKKFGLSCINLKSKPFLAFDEIVNTCRDYGYNI